MTLVESLKLPRGTKMPRFHLKDPFGKTHSCDDLFGEKGLLVIFTCNHCPYAKAQWGRVLQLARYARQHSINTVAINPNIHPDYPADSPEKMKEKIRELGIDFPYLVDDTQDTARAFKAQCTPDPYLFDCSWQLVYHGRIDDSWRDESRVTRQELKKAIDRLAEGRPPVDEQTPSMGCSIKWRYE